jgi:hypothetical protein
MGMMWTSWHLLHGHEKMLMHGHKKVLLHGYKEVHLFWMVSQ